MSKLVFIDSSVYINCALKQADKLSLKILKDFLSKIENREMILLLPEITKNEVLYGVKVGFEDIKQALCGNKGHFVSIKNTYDSQKKNKPKTSEIIGSIIDEAKKMAAERVEKECFSAIEIIEKIFNHHYVKIIKITDELILAGMRRSLLKLAPASGKEGHYIKDQDCIIFESILQYLKHNKELKKYSLVICADDKDYFKEDTDQLKPDIEKNLQKSCDLIVGYKNPLQMLNKEFKDKYTDKQIKTYDDIAKLSSLPLPTVTSTTRASSLPLSTSTVTTTTSSLLQNSLGVMGNANACLNLDGYRKCPQCGNLLLSYENICAKCGTASMFIPSQDISDLVKI